MASKKKKTSKKGRGTAARPKKAKSSPSPRKPRAGRRKPNKPKQTVHAPYTELAGAAYGWGRIGAAARGAASQRWKRRTPSAGSTGKVVHLPALPSGGAAEASHPLVQAFARAGGTPPGYVRSGPYVGPQRPWPKKEGKKTSGKKTSAKKPAAKKTGKTSSKKPSLSKEEFLKKMAAGRAAAAAKKGNKKPAAKKPASAAAASSKKPSPAKKSPAKKPNRKKTSKLSPARAASSKKRAHAPAVTKKRRSSRRKGWPKAGKFKRTFGIAKFQAMNSLGVPPNHPRAKAKRAQLREASGRTITAKDVFNLVEGTGMKAWVCSGMRRTGCGGGSKMLRGSHQIGVFAVPKALQR